MFTPFINFIIMFLFFVQIKLVSLTRIDKTRLKCIVSIIIYIVSNSGKIG